MQNKNVVMKYIMTEKSSFLTEKVNQYSFYVDKDANKFQIKKTIENLYAVEITDVSTMRLGGGKKIKKYTNKGVFHVTKTIRKKAIVTVKKGQVIDFSQEVK